jgi:LPS export ABC transporter protein LptC
MDHGIGRYYFTGSCRYFGGVYQLSKNGDPGEAQLAQLSEDVSISIGTVHHTATRDGVTEWQVDAESAEYIPEKQEVLFKDLSAVFFVENDRKVTLVADQGILKKDTNDIEVTGNVLVIDDMFQLKTSQLAYEHQNPCHDQFGSC